jgi:hypothetical protein
MIRASNKVPVCELPSRRTRNGQAGYIVAPCLAIHLRKKRLFTSDRPYIRVLHPAPDDLVIGQIEGVLQVEQAGDKARSQGRATMFGPHGFIGNLVDGVPVDQLGQHDERMVQVEVFQQGEILPL